jgi:hypothetical protein
MVYDKARLATPEPCRLRSEAALRRPEPLANIPPGRPEGPDPDLVRHRHFGTDLLTLDLVASPAATGARTGGGTSVLAQAARTSRR